MTAPRAKDRERAWNLIGVPLGMEAHREHLAAIEERVAAALAETREECARIADRCATERHRQIQPCADAGGALEALMGKESEARRIAAAIREGGK